MTLSERDQVYVEHMLECIERVERFVGQDRNFFRPLGSGCGNPILTDSLISGN